MTEPNAAHAGSDEELAHLYRSAAPAAGGHPPEDDWVRFATGELREDQRVALADHALRCSDCAAILRVVSEVRSGAAAVNERMGPPAMRWSMTRSIALAASIAIAVGGLWLWRSQSQSLSSPPSTAAVTPSAAPAAVPAPSITTASGAPSVPLWAGLGEPPIVRLPAGLLTMRGTSTDRDAFMTAFGAAIAPYRQGRFADAIQGLETVARDHPGIVEASFYEGAARLFGSGEPAMAAAAFARATGSEVVGDEAQWLEAVALARSGRLADATRRLEVLCGGASAYRQRACEAIARP